SRARRNRPRFGKASSACPRLTRRGFVSRIRRSPSRSWDLAIGCGTPTSLLQCNFLGDHEVTEQAALASLLNSATVMTSLERFVRDLFHSFRALRRVPSFTATITLTLAVGIGAATTIFSAMKGTLLEPLPYPEHDRLVELVHEAPGLGIDSLRASPAIYFAYRDYAETFDAVGLWDWDDSPVTVVIDGEPESVASVEVTHEVLPMLGAEPIRGRAFTEADTRAGGAPTVIL